jgi:NAD(P)-dependent dehydrogenase (short-subunit alcohol dehydrogenase family)
MRDLDGKVAFVTGGGSGIGFGMVRNFLNEGMKVAVADYNDAHLAEVREALKGSNRVHFLKVDVSNRDQLRAAAQETLEVFGRIHVLCNNAGVGGGGTADDPEFDDWDRALGVNLGGVVNGSKIIVPIIKAQGEGGHVVNTSSMAGVVPLPSMGAYATAKYAVRGFTDSLRMALAPEGIGVSCLFPGLTRTRIVDLPEGRPDADPDDPAEQMAAKFRAAMAVAMDPLELGAMVVRGIKANAPYIVTHREFLEEVQTLNKELEDAFPVDQEVPEARAQFEDTRRTMAAGLAHMKAKD